MTLSRISINRLHNYIEHLPNSKPTLVQRTAQMRYIDHISKTSRFTHYSWIHEFSAQVLSELLWLYWLFPSTLDATRRYFTYTNNCSYFLRWKQTLECLFLAFEKVHPADYYYFELWKPSAKNNLSKYFFDRNNKQAIRYANKPGAISTLTNKYQFHLFCQQHQLPSPTLVALVDNKHIEWQHESGLPNADVFFKPTKGSCSQGIERWDRILPTTYEQREGSPNRSKRLLIDQLIEHFLVQSQSTSYIIEKRLKNHKLLEPITDNRLLTIRLLTIVTDEKYEALFALATIPCKKSNISLPWNDTHLFSHIDLEIGTLHGARHFVPGYPAVERHPDSGKKLTHFQIPYWKEAIQLALQAHRALPGIFIIGWDLAITDQGPVLIEGNSAPGLIWHQVAGGKPLGETPLADALVQRLERLQAEEHVEKMMRRREQLSRLWRCRDWITL